MPLMYQKDIGERIIKQIKSLYVSTFKKIVLEVI